MKFAYADPPYLGCGESHYGYPEWDKPERHAELIALLNADYPDGWAMSLHVPSLRVILPMCPDDVRVCAWVKPFASFKPNVPRAWTWEPVIVRGGRALGRGDMTVRDHVSANITLKRGLTGAKPDEFCRWLFQFLGAQWTDELHDLYPGSGAVTRAWDQWCNQLELQEADD